jgi:hypothetical protein
MRGLRGNEDSLVRQVEQLRSRGRIRSGEAEVAIVEALRAQFGGGAAGSLTTGQAGTLTGLLSNLRSSFSDLMQGMKLSSLPGMRAFRTFLEGLVNALSAGSATGRRLQAVIRGIVNSVGTGLFSGIDVTAVFTRVLDVVDTVWRVVSAFGRGFGSTFMAVLRPMLSTLGRLFGFSAQGASSTKIYERLGQAIGAAAGVIVVGLGVAIATIANFYTATAGAVSDVIGIWQRFGQWYMALATWLQGIGNAIVDGIINGIRSGATRLLTAVQEVFGTGLVDAVRGALQIRSPSRVMAELGAYTAEGFQRGLEAETPRVQMSMGSLVAAPAAARGGGARGGPVSITVHVDASGAGSPDAVGAAIEARLLELFEGRALTLGAAEFGGDDA